MRLLQSKSYWEPRQWFVYEEALRKLEGSGCGGLYQVCLPTRSEPVKYPNGESSVLYIGRAINLYQRLKKHKEGRTKVGRAIYKFAKELGIKNPWQELEVGLEILLLSVGELREEERKLLTGFMEKFGSRPRFNLFLDRSAL